MADVSVPCEQANHQQGKAAMLKKHLSRFHWGSALLTLPFITLFCLFQIAPMIWYLSIALFMKKLGQSTTTLIFSPTIFICKPLRTPSGYRLSVVSSGYSFLH